MGRHFTNLVLCVGLILSFAWDAAAQGSAVQLRLTNSMPQRVDYYLVRPAGTAPKFVGSLPPAMMVDVQAQPADKWVFAVERRKFQEYDVRPEPFQHLTLAPAGLQSQAEVAMAYQPVIGTPVAASPAPLPPATAPPTAALPPVAPPTAATPPPPVASVAPPPVVAASSPDGAVWTFLQYNAPENGALVANLVFGIPETDAIQLLAVCGPRSIVGLPAVTFVADVSNFTGGSPSLLSVKGGGLDASIPAVVLRAPGGEGMEGFVADIDVTNPFWTALNGSGALVYAGQGTSPRSVPLAGSSAPLSQFLNACRSLAAGATVAAAPPAPVGGAPAGGNATCQTMAGVKSENGGQVVVVEFVNRTNETRGVNWMDFEGVPQSYGMLEPGQSIGIETWTTHPWMLTDGPGNCIEMVMPSTASAVFDITVPSPPGGFGPE